MKNLIKFGLCTFLLVISIDIVNKILLDERIYSKSSEFYENTNPFEYDVLFLGSSHITRTVIPMELWKNYGITSYNLGNLGQTKPVDYWVLRDALQKVHPKVVVVDIYPLSMNEKTNVGSFYGIMHETFDLMPLSITKIQALIDLFDFSTAFQYFFPLEYAHINWEIFTDYYSDQLARTSISKGVRLDVHDDDNNAMVVLNGYPSKDRDNDHVISDETVSKEYLRKIIELCKSNDIEVLLMNAPYIETEDEVKWDNSAELIAKDYNIEFLNFCKMDAPVNYRVDSYDSGNHVNSSGARKVTRILGKYLQDNYSIYAHQEDELNERWNRYYINFLKQKVDDLKRQNCLESYLMLLSDDDYDVIIDFNSAEALKSEIIVELLANLGINISELNSQSYILLREGKNAEIYPHMELDNHKKDTIIGKLNIGRREDNFSIVLDDKEVYYNEQYNDIPDGVLRFFVLDSKTHDLLDQCSICYVNELKNEVVR